MDPWIVVLIALGCLIVGAFIGMIYRKRIGEAKLGSAEQRAKEVMRAAGEYCEDAMKRTEDVLSRSLEELKLSHGQFRQAVREQQDN